MKRKDFNKSSIKNPEHFRNEIRFKLLVALPSFQKDVREIRNELNIQPDKFTDDEAFANWYEKFVVKSDTIRNSRDFLEAKARLNTIKEYAEYLKQEWKLNDKIPLFRFRHRVEILGKKYKLPANFYDNQSNGLPVYIMRNIMIPPANNWTIQQDPDGGKGTTKWFAIKTYAPLSKKEISEAKKWLVSLQKHYFPKEITITSRIKKQFDRDLLAFKELVLERKHKPVKRKKYEEHSYLSLVKKNYKLSPKEFRELERLHKNDIVTNFDEIITKETAKKLKMKPAAVRQAIRRIFELIKTFFGDEFIAKQ